MVLTSMASRARTSHRLARSAIGGLFFLITRYAELLRTRVNCGLAQKKNQGRVVVWGGGGNLVGDDPP